MYFQTTYFELISAEIEERITGKCSKRISDGGSERILSNPWRKNLEELSDESLAKILDKHSYKCLRDSLNGVVYKSTSETVPGNISKFLKDNRNSWKKREISERISESLRRAGSLKPWEGFLKKSLVKNLEDFFEKFLEKLLEISPKKNSWTKLG